MLRFAILAFVVGCSGAAVGPPVTKPTPAAVPSVRFAIADGTSVRIMRVTERGLATERTITTPDVVDQLYWIGPDPAVWLHAGDPRWPGMAGDPDAVPTGHEGEMGFLTAAGYAKFTPVAWPPVDQPSDEESFGMASAISWNKLVPTLDDELYESHCSWYGGPDGGWCMRWTYYRRYPDPGFAPDPTKHEGAGWRLPKVAAPSTVHAALVEHKPLRGDGEDDETYAGHRVKTKLACSVGANTIEWPEPTEDGDLDPVMEDPIWLSAEPPIFVTSTTIWAGVGPSPAPTPAVFEGCTPSKRFAHVAGGPHGLVAIFGTALTILWNGKAIATSPIGGARLAFEATK